jgi:flagellar motor switch protein FliG
MTRTEKLVAYVNRLDGIELQNRLMGITDRELAMALRGVSESQRESVLSSVSYAKRRRVREEIALHERLAIADEQFAGATDRVIARLEGPKRSGVGARSYLRPLRRRRL